MDTKSHDERLALALDDLAKQTKPNYLGTSKKYNVACSTLKDRYNGKSLSRKEASSHYRQRLTNAQEEILVRQINRLTERGMPPTPRMVRNFAEEMIKRPVGKNWTAEFVKRHHDELLSIYLRGKDHDRVKSEYSATYKQFYDLLKAGIEKYHITADNMYNWDEKGFMIGQVGATRRIMSLEAYESGRIPQACQDGSREFISLLACVSAIGDALPPSLIYKGDSGTLQDTWLQDLGDDIIAHFAVAHKGWSCDALGYNWLGSVFDRYTRERAGRGRRLLLVDGHSSHVNLKFLELCDRLRILVLILPSHSTHRLQPLDVSVFSPLSTYYTQHLNTLMWRSLGLVSMSKRSFWSVFWPSWQQAFTEKNIKSGFASTGIWPYNPEIVMKKITKPPKIERPEPITPMTCRAVRRLHRQYRDAPNSPIIEKILRANERLAAQHSIDGHMIEGFVTALKEAKQKQKGGKRLNLLGEEDPGPQFFSPARIKAALDWAASKQAEEAAEELEKKQRKQATEARKQREEAEKVQRREAQAHKRRMAAEVKVQKQAERQVQNEARDAAKRLRLANVRPQGKATGATKKCKGKQKAVGRDDDVPTPTVVHRVSRRTAHGRVVQRPSRYAT